MADDRQGAPQAEVQLGHLCNNRCVFCVSGHLTSLRQAPILDPGPILERIRAARDAGQRRLTILGGEPTVQPFFMEVVRHAVSLGFDEVVIFSNGSRTARAEVVDEILATGGRFEWRFSFQGATQEAHERTTRRKGSFAQLVASLEHVAARAQKATVNMCVVRQNYESLDRFPELLLPRGVRQLHVDMVHPDDMPNAADPAEVLVRYRDLVGPLERMVAGFPDGFDVNIGNLPYCVAPHLAPWIHHGGQETWTATVDGAGELVPSWNKYERKQQNTVKPERCRACVFDDRCSGVFRQYADLYGLDEIAPVPPERLRALDPARRLWPLPVQPLLARALAGLAPPWRATHVAVDEERASVRLAPAEAAGAAGATGATGELTITLERRGAGVAATDLGALRVAGAAATDGSDAAARLAALRALYAALVAAGARGIHPPAEDAVAAAAPRVAARLARLRAAAPFEPLAWTEARLRADGRRAEAVLEGPAGERATVWMEEHGAGYAVEAGGASPALAQGLRAVLVALGRLPAEAARPQAE